MTGGGSKRRRGSGQSRAHNDETGNENPVEKIESRSGDVRARAHACARLASVPRFLYRSFFPAPSAPPQPPFRYLCSLWSLSPPLPLSLPFCPLPVPLPLLRGLPLQGALPCVAFALAPHLAPAHTRTRAHGRTHTRTHTHVRAHICMHICTHVLTHMHTRVHASPLRRIFTVPLLCLRIFG